MSRLTFHPALPAGVAHIGANLRQADRVELAVTSPSEEPAAIVARSVADSRWAIVAAVDDVPAIVYGVAPSELSPHIGHPWMLATDDLLKVRREFARRCRDEIRLMSMRFACLTNQVHRDNALSIRWLQWGGFTIDYDRPVGPNDELLVFWKGACRRV